MGGVGCIRERVGGIRCIREGGWDGVRCIKEGELDGLQSGWGGLGRP